MVGLDKFREAFKNYADNEPAKYELYRFVDDKTGYLEMIELLSRHSGVIGSPKGLVIELR